MVRKRKKSQSDALYDARIDELKVKRRRRAMVKTDEIRPTTLAKLVRLHLIRKGGGRLLRSAHVDLEKRLTVALDPFGRTRDPRAIDPDEVREWAKELAADGTRKPGTVRHYLNALSGLDGERTAPGHRPERVKRRPIGPRRLRQLVPCFPRSDTNEQMPAVL